MKAHARKHTKNAAILTTVAESIGSALGTIAAKANAAQKVISRSSAAHVVQREGKRLARRSKTVASKTKKAAANLKRSKAAKAARRGLRRATSSIKRAARRR